MRLLVTRPETDSIPLAALLENQGHQPLIAPLLVVENIREALPPLDGVAALIFTSANGVRAFVAASPRRNLPCYAVGDRTCAALREAGFETIESAAGDVESLVKLITERRQPDAGPLVHIAGSDVAGDVVGSLEQAGFSVTRAVLYRTTPGTLTPESIDALRAGGIDGVLLFSPRTGKIFADLIHSAGLAETLRGVTAWCLSGAVGEALGGLPFSRVAAPSIPTQDALLALLNLPEKSVTGSATAETAPPRPKDMPLTDSRPIASEPRPKVLIYGLIAVVALVAGGVAAELWMPPLMPGWHGPLPPPPPPSVDVVLRPLPAAAPIPPTPAKIAAPAPDPRIDGLSQAVIALQRRVAELDATLKSTSDHSALDQVVADQRTLGVTVAALEARVERIGTALRQADDAAATTHALLLATEDLRQDLLSSASYQGPFSVLRTLAGHDPQISGLLEPLASGAANGIPSRTILAQQLDGLARDLAEPAPLAESASWWQRLLARVERLVVIRHVTNEAGPATAAGTARLAAVDLDHGDLAGAVTRMAAISGADAARVAPWLATARARLRAEQAADTLTAALSARLATPVPLGTDH